MRSANNGDQDDDDRERKKNTYSKLLCELHLVEDENRQLQTTY